MEHVPLGSTKKKIWHLAEKFPCFSGELYPTKTAKLR